MIRLKKMMALAIAMVMVICTMNFAVMAAPGDLSVNSKLTVSGLGAGDKVEYYQILKWDVSEATGDPANGWVWGTFATPDAEKKVNGMLASDIYGANDRQNKITDVIAGKLGEAATTAMSSPASPKVNSNGEWIIKDVPAGLYMVIVTSGTPGTMYNPIFVAANFYGNGEQPDTSNSWITTSDPTYSNNAMAKMSTIPVEKEADSEDDDDADTVDVGETVNFTVTTKVPKFASNYKDPVFIIEDKLKGLEVDIDSVTVTGAASTDYDKTKLTPGTDDEWDSGYSIRFKKNFLQNVPATGQEITVTYSAVVTDKALQNVNQETNTVEIKFSIDPKDTTGYGLLRDETNHFTFSLDANILGDEYENESSTEAIKVGLDKEGNPIVSEKSYATSTTKHAALEGATFKLYKEKACTNLYTNPEFNGEVASDGMGRLTIKGLDVGTYWLKEETAPNGFIKMQDPIEVTITADITQNVQVVDEVDYNGTKVKVTYYTNVLNGYTVTVGGATTTYTIKNSKYIATSTTIRPGSSDAELVNTKGVELPATGGIGTTIFYVIGAVLVLGAGILLVTRRRMDTF